MPSSEMRYTPHDIRQPNGELRRVYKPTEELAEEQVEVLKVLHRARIERFMPHAHGGVKGRSPLTNARAHQNGKEFYKLDLWHAYPSVETDHLKRMATIAFTHLTDTMGWHEVDDIVDNTVMAHGIEGLPTGFLTSPMFFNIYCMELDAKLSAISLDNDLTYTRFADDLTFSGPRHVFASEALRRKIRRTIVEQPGGSIRHSKARIEAMHKGVTITGISLTSDPEYIHPAKELLQGVEEYLAFCESRQSLTMEEQDRLHGFNSVLHMAGDPAESKSRYVRELYECYQKLAARP